MAKRGQFRKESGLVRALVRSLKQPDSPVVTLRHAREFDYVSGRTDVLGLLDDDSLVAFEAKLRDWRRALHQAWRNSSFANRAYVALPVGYEWVAEKHRDDFEQLGVGLCFVSGNGIDLAIASRYSEPLMPWLHQRARDALSNG